MWKEKYFIFTGRKIWYYQIVLFSLIFGFNSVPVKMPANSFVDIKLFLKFKWWGRGFIIATSVLKEKNKFRGLTPPDFQDFCKAVVIMRVVLVKGQTKRWMEQNVETEIDLYTYRQLIFDEGTKVIQWSKDSLYNQCGWNNWTSVCKKMNPWQNEVNCIRDLSAKCKTVELLEDNTGENLGDPGYTVGFWDTHLQRGTVQWRKNKLAFTKIKNFCPAKYSVKRMRP